MALPAWLISLIPSAFNSAREYINRKQKISELKTEHAIVLEEKKLESAIRRAESADVADTALDKASIEDTGWKDEYLLLITTFPMVLLFVSPFFDILYSVAPVDILSNTEPGQVAQAVSTGYQRGMIASAVTEGFKALALAPTYYWWGVLAVYIHSLGMRRMVRILLDSYAERFIGGPK